MPLAFASTLGGTLTMIGSAANLLASDCATLADLRGIEPGFPKSLGNTTLLLQLILCRWVARACLYIPFGNMKIKRGWFGNPLINDDFHGKSIELNGGFSSKPLLMTPESKILKLVWWCLVDSIARFQVRAAFHGEPSHSDPGHSRLDNFLKGSSGPSEGKGRLVAFKSGLRFIHFL